MRFPVAIVTALAAASTPAFAGDDSFTVHRHKVAVGDKWTEEKTDQTQTRVGTDKPSVIVTETTVKKTIEVLRVDAAGHATAEKVAYATAKTTELVDRTEKSKPDLLAGKTYKLTTGAAGAPFTVEAVTGKASAAELDAIRKLEKRFGKGEQLDKVLDGKTFEKDQEVTLPAAELDAAYGDEPPFQHVEMRLTYQGTTKQVAAFAYTMKMVGDLDGTHYELYGSGTVEVDAKTDAILDMKLTAGLQATGGKAPFVAKIDSSAHRS